MVNDKHFDTEIYKGFRNYCYTHMLTQTEQSMLYVVTVDIHEDIKKMIEERKEDSTMKASRTAVAQTDAAEETTRRMA